MLPSLDSKAAQDCKIMAGVSVCLNGDDNVDVLVSEDFTLSNVPTGSTITWQVSGFATILTSNGGKTATINWAGNQDPTQVTVTATLTNPNTGSITLSITIQLRGIPVNCSINGYNTVSSCCSAPLTYTVQNFGNGNTFFWTVSNPTWAIVSGQGTSTVTVIPSQQGTSDVRCAVGMTTSPTLLRQPSKSVTRSNAETPSKMSGSFPVGQTQNRVCRGQTHTFAANPICGASGLTRSFPASWGVANQTGPSATITVGNAAVSGNIVMTATFAGGCAPTTQTYPISVTTAAPIAPVISDNGSYLYYHCGQWRFPGSGSVSFSSIPPNTEQLVFTVTSPWSFQGGGTTKTVNVNTSTVLWSPTIVGPSGAAPGTFKMKAVNCMGSSTWAQTTIYREPYTYWYTNPYPEWCECCEVPCNGCPPYPQKADIEPPITQILRILPNPCRESTTLHLPINDEGGYELAIYDIQGRRVKQMRVFQAMTDIDVSTLSSGIYHVVAKGNSESFTQKMLITK